MGAAVTVDCTELVEALRSYERRGESPPVPVLTGMLLAEIDDLIQSEGANGAQGKWAPLSANTLKRHPRRVGGKLLQDTGALAAFQGRDGADWFEATSIAVDRRGRPYSGYHQTGTKNMPRRDPVDIELGPFLERCANVILEDIANAHS